MYNERHRSRLLEAARDFRVAPSDTDVAIFNFLSSIDTPRALTVWLMYKHRNHDALAGLDIDPGTYNNGYQFRLDYTATTFLSKASFLRTSFDRKKVAVAKFLQYEDLCRRTNRRFVSSALDPLNHGSNVWLLNATKRKIQQILGDFSCDEFVDEANWGPGVSTLVKGEEVSGYNKFRDERGITRELYSFLSDWFPVAYPSWHTYLSSRFGAEKWYNHQVGNVIVTVPKNSKTDRVIAIEPGFNLWFQKGIGSMIRRRLRRFGIDLNSQTTNQNLARSGSLTGLLATVDFSSASDSISREVVRELLPPRWYQILDICRSKVGKTSDGSIVQWEKFSSMGNGFTFELESLIFFAAASAVSEYLADDSPISVFGDDVIIGAPSYSLFSEFAVYLGFRVNESKSFSSGHFRESCGSHYYSGIDCKPIFLKERLTNVETIFKLANNVRSLAHRHNFYRGCDSRFWHCWNHLYGRVPENLRFKVPLQAGDTGFISNWDESTPRRARYGIEGFYYQCLVSVGVSRQGDGEPLILAHLRRLGPPRLHPEQRIGQSIRDLRQLRSRAFLPEGFLPSEPPLKSGNSYDLRGRSRRKIANPLVAQWYNLGEWR